MTARPFGASRRQLADELTRECLLGGGMVKLEGEEKTEDPETPMCGFYHLEGNSHMKI